MKELSLSELNPPLNPILIEKPCELPIVRDFLEKVDVFGLDTETNIVDTLYRRRIRTIQVGDRNEQYIIDLLAIAGSTEALIDGQGSKTTSEWAKPVVEALRPAFDTDKRIKVGHHIQFDYEVLRWCLGLRTWGLYCTMLVEQILQAGLVHYKIKNFWGLEDLLGRYSGVSLSKDLQRSFDLASPLTQEQVNYAALDTRVVLGIRLAQRKLCSEHGLERVVCLENAAIPAFGDMAINGFFLDPEDWKKVVVETEAKHKEHIATLDKHFIPVVGVKQAPDVNLDVLEKRWKDETDKETRAVYRQEFYKNRHEVAEWKENAPTYEGEAAINYNSSSQLLSALRKLGFTSKKLPDTNDTTLGKHSDKAVIRAIQDFRDTQKRLSTYGLNFLKYIDPDTGRIHSDINQIGAETGRSSSTKPNLFNIPKGSAYRRCFKARPGYKLVIADMAGAELRIMAELSGEPAWIAAFSKNWDVHSMGAEMMYKDRWYGETKEGCLYQKDHQKCSCPGHKEIRNKVKATNFKVAYGGEDLSEDLSISRSESNDIMRLWRNANRVLNAYLTRSGEETKRTLKSRTFSGRIRHFKKPDWNLCKKQAIERLAKDEKELTKNNIDVMTGKLYAQKYGHIEREGKNTPIQGGNADIAKEAMGAGFDKNGLGYMWHRLEPDFGALLVNFVYDEFVAECPDDKAQACADFIGDCIRRSGAEFMAKVTMEYEANVEERWIK